MKSEVFKMYPCIKDVNWFLCVHLLCMKNRQGESLRKCFNIRNRGQKNKKANKQGEIPRKTDYAGFLKYFIPETRTSCFDKLIYKKKGLKKS